MAHLTQINFAELTGPQRVVAYNEMAVKLDRPLVKKFENSSKAIARCEALQAILTDRPTPEVTVSDHFIKLSEVKGGTELKEKVAKSRVSQVESRKRNVAARKEAARATGVKPVRGVKSDERVIKLLVDAYPHREGTNKQAHFEKMRGGITVAKYLAKFTDDARGVARHWLYNIIKDGLAEAK